MKKIITYIMILLTSSICIIGCKNIPTNDELEAKTETIGKIAGYIAKQKLIDIEVKDAVTNVLQYTSNVVPATNETFSIAWNQLAVDHINDMIEKNKISKEKGCIVLSVFKIMTRGIDYIINVKYPGIKKYTDLISVVVNSFINGFMQIYSKNDSFEIFDFSQIDEDAYEYMMK